ncbi:alpha/beta hydrolase fold domain-containing protein [Sphingomonas sp. AAP5]|uniref:alpha/beta hydrolase fold domain-containing protein n=1 Tax=Sphingomonas sp. AAP5 TaxID=1523415 RepID=UPI001404E912|nr:alpha/beta hydrolase fold domain-containing protein [Sphingomonas sp. AAP5]
MRGGKWMGLALLAGLASGAVQAQEAKHATLTLDADGTIHADGVRVPPSNLLSADARAQFAARLQQGPPPSAAETGVASARAASDKGQKATLDRWLALAPSDITAVVMNGVHTDVVVPKTGIAPENAARVLINLHGGGFSAGAKFGGQAESVPLAARGRIKVVAVDYRLSPEYLFPAASEDVEAVYRKLLETYRSENIGIYGCSAGGTLTAQAVAWLQKKGLPRPGAIGIFCSGAMPGFWFGGDSGALGSLLNAIPPQANPNDAKKGAPRFYLAGVDANDPLVTPGLFPQVLAQFPPTLIVTGTRDIAMSNALVTNVQLLQAGVDTQLLVLEGIGHGQFNAFAGSPEARETYDIIWRFFDKHLGARKR